MYGAYSIVLDGFLSQNEIKKGPQGRGLPLWAKFTGYSGLVGFNLVLLAYLRSCHPEGQRILHRIHAPFLLRNNHTQRSHELNPS